MKTIFFSMAMLFATVAHADWYNDPSGNTKFTVGEILFQPEVNGPLPYATGPQTSGPVLRVSLVEQPNPNLYFYFSGASLDIAKSHLSILMTAASTGKKVQFWVTGCTGSGTPNYACNFNSLILQP